MILVKILKRKDASSVLLAVLIALIVWQPLGQVTSRLSARISGLHGNQYYNYAPPGSGWHAEYLYPLVSVFVELIVLEVLCWIYVWTVGSMKKK